MGVASRCGDGHQGDQYAALDKIRALKVVLLELSLVIGVFSLQRPAAMRRRNDVEHGLMCEAAVATRRNISTKVHCVEVWAAICKSDS